jgi:mono/diheme cytochrome c family protein
MKPKIVALCLVPGLALVAVAPLFAVQNHNRPARAAHPVVRRGAPPQGHTAEEEGERVFNQNCARCHNAPDGFSRRITGIIVQHMRVRANLSRHDEEVLLHYLNP